jgi:hypothetical protein
MVAIWFELQKRSISRKVPVLFLYIVVAGAAVGWAWSRERGLAGVRGRVQASLLLMVHCLTPDTFPALYLKQCVGHCTGQGAYFALCLIQYDHQASSWWRTASPQQAICDASPCWILWPLKVTSVYPSPKKRMNIMAPRLIVFATSACISGAMSASFILP